MTGQKLIAEAGCSGPRPECVKVCGRPGPPGQQARVLWGLPAQQVERRKIEEWDDNDVRRRGRKRRGKE